MLTIVWSHWRYRKSFFFAYRIYHLDIWKSESHWPLMLKKQRKLLFLWNNIYRKVACDSWVWILILCFLNRSFLVRGANRKLKTIRKTKGLNMKISCCWLVEHVSNSPKYLFSILNGKQLPNFELLWKVKNKIYKISILLTTCDLTALYTRVRFFLVQYYLRTLCSSKTGQQNKETCLKREMVFLGIQSLYK